MQCILSLPAYAMTITGVLPELWSSSMSFCKATVSMTPIWHGTVQRQLRGKPNWDKKQKNKVEKQDTEAFHFLYLLRTLTNNSASSTDGIKQLYVKDLLKIFPDIVSISGCLVSKSYFYIFFLWNILTTVTPSLQSSACWTVLSDYWPVCWSSQTYRIIWEARSTTASLYRAAKRPIHVTASCING